MWPRCYYSYSPFSYLCRADLLELSQGQEEAMTTALLGEMQERPAMDEMPRLFDDLGLVARIRQRAKDGKTRIIIVDSLNGFLNAMPGEQFLAIQLHELLTYLNQLGMATFMVLAQHGLIGREMESVVDVSYLADSVLLLRYFEADGEVKQAMSVLKKRSGGHERSIRELKLHHGIKVGKPLLEFRGVLSGIPERDQGRELATAKTRNGRKR